MTKEKSARQIVTEWVQSYIEDLPSYVIPDVAKAAQDHFKSDHALLSKLTEHAQYGIFYGIVGSLGRINRQSSPEILLTDSGLVTSHGTVYEAAKKHNVFQKWFENNGKEQVYVLEQTPSDLLNAARMRIRDGQTDLRLAALWIRVRNALVDVGAEKVGDHYTVEELERIKRDLTLPEINSLTQLD